MKPAYNRINLIDKKFERLIVIKWVFTKKKKPYYKCLCDCGKEVIVDGVLLRNKKIKSCGCLKKETALTNINKALKISLENEYITKENFVGKTFQHLTILDLIKKGFKKYFVCKCVCGNLSSPICDSVIKHKVKSCGKCDISKQKERVSLKDSVHRNLYNKYTKSASTRGFCFELTKEQFIKIIYDNCYYCNRKNTNSSGKTGVKNKQKIHHVGLDRVDNTKGYTLDNVVPCCKYCNWIKLDFSLNEFKNMIKLIYENLNLRDFKPEEMDKVL